MKRRLLCILLCMWMLILLIPLISAATNTTHMNTVEKTIEQIESGFMVGLMHVKHIKTGWGWTEVWTPIYILITTESNGRHLLRPSAGSFIPYDIDGFVGTLYYIFSNPYLSGPFFIRAYVTVYEIR